MFSQYSSSCHCSFNCVGFNYHEFGNRECQLLDQVLSADDSNGAFEATWTYGSVTSGVY